jgi:hypothetical protein
LFVRLVSESGQLGAQRLYLIALLAQTCNLALKIWKCDFSQREGWIICPDTRNLFGVSDNHVKRVFTRHEAFPPISEKVLDGKLKTLAQGLKTEGLTLEA